MISSSFFSSRRQLVEGPGDANSGAWQISWYRIAKGWGMLPVEYWPDQESVEGTVVPNEPPNADLIAKQHRLAHYQRLHSELECLYAATAPHRALAVALEINSAWKNPRRGRIEFNPDLPVKAVHSIGIHTFDFETNSFVFPNTWGREWGLDGIGFLPFGYLNRFMVDAWSMSLDTVSQSERPGIYWNKYHADKSQLGLPYVFDIRDGDADIIVGWGHAILRRRTFDVEEVFIRPEYRRRGYGTMIVDHFRKAVAEVDPPIPIRFLVPWGDHVERNAASLLGWAKKQKLRLMPSNRRWAAYIAIDGEPVDALPELTWIPTKATSPLHLLEDPPLVAPPWDEAKELRRATLIEKEYQSSLTAEEEAELDRLQVEFGDYQDFIAPLPQEEGDV